MAEATNTALRAEVTTLATAQAHAQAQARAAEAERDAARTAAADAADREHATTERSARAVAAAEAERDTARAAAGQAHQLAADLAVAQQELGAARAQATPSGTRRTR